MFNRYKRKTSLSSIKGKTKMNSSIYIMAGGGAGDFIFHYFTNEKWKLIKPIKEKFPKINLTAVIACHTGSEYELTFLNPYINSHLIYKWYPPGHEKEKLWQESITGIDIKKFAEQKNISPSIEKPELFLSDSEKNIIKDFKDQEYIAIHPFAGLPHRGCKIHPLTKKYECFPDYKYIETAEILANKGYKVIFIGNTNTSYDSLRANDESLNIPNHENIYNFINVGSFRLRVALAIGAKGFIGSHSSMLSAAWTHDVPSLFFYPGFDEHGNKRSVIENGGTTGTWALDRPYHSYWELSGEDFVNKLKPEEVINKLFENIRIRNV